jgi:N-acyl-D-amino-acid deacylase
MVCTDSSLVSAKRIESGRAWNKHPRSFRTYPQFFSHYVRDRGILDWPLAVYKCTKLPAGKMKLDDRGVIRPGAYADIVLLDPEGLDPGVDFRDQTTPPKGIEYVFINGQLALEKGEMTNIRAGRPLYAYGNRKP